MWQVRHKKDGVFMGVNHCQGHYHLESPCCFGLGVWQFTSIEQAGELIRMAGGPHLPPHARKNREDFIIEPWSSELNDYLENLGVLENATNYSRMVISIYPVGLN